MNNKAYWSVFAPDINGFISIKRSLGYKYEGEERVLHTFDRFVLAEHHTCTGLTKEIADKWAQRRNNEAKLTLYGKVRIVKQFAEYLRDQGISTLSCPDIALD